jgi:hypothetical protein
LGVHHSTAPEVTVKQSTLTYWVTWSCDGNEFDAAYDTREERDARVVKLSAEEAEGKAQQLLHEPFAHDISIYETLHQGLGDEALTSELRANGFRHPRDGDGAAPDTVLTRDSLTKIGRMWLDLRKVKTAEYEVWLDTHLEANPKAPVVYCTYRQGDDVLFAQVMTLVKTRNLVGTFLAQ